ncbi:MAG: hypothetical protein Q8K63_15885 [Acidimicrobiales bacterium]|nr:hypothetical protein [Acidimicrobiales bacterium]
MNFAATWLTTRGRHVAHIAVWAGDQGRWRSLCFRIDSHYDLDTKARVQVGDWRGRGGGSPVDVVFEESRDAAIAERGLCAHCRSRLETILAAGEDLLRKAHT